MARTREILKKPLHLTIDADVVDKLEKIAVDQKRTLSNLCNFALDEWMKELYFGGQQLK